MSASLTNYWQEFIQRMVETGRYNSRSEVINAGLRALEELETAGAGREFDRVFAGGRAGNPGRKTLDRIAARQKILRSARE